MSLVGWGSLLLLLITSDDLAEEGGLPDERRAFFMFKCADGCAASRWAFKVSS